MWASLMKHSRMHEFLISCLRCPFPMARCEELDMVIIIQRTPKECILIIDEKFKSELKELVSISFQSFVTKYIKFVKDIRPLLPLDVQLEAVHPVLFHSGPNDVVVSKAVEKVDILLMRMQINLNAMKLSIAHKNWCKVKKNLKAISPQNDDDCNNSGVLFKAYTTRLDLAKIVADYYKIIKYGLMTTRIKGLAAEHRKFAAAVATKSAIDTNYYQIGLSHICPKGQGLIMDNGAIFESHRVLRSCPKKGHRQSFIDAMAKKKKKACAYEKCRKYTTQNQKCTRCQSVFYCSRKCQKKHWKIMHRSVCKK